MRKFWGYLGAQSKRTVKLLPSVIAFCLLLALGVGTVAAGFLLKEKTQDNKTKISLGVVGDTEDRYFSMGLLALQEIDASKFYIDIKEMERDEAEDLVRRGKMTAFLVIPDGFVDAVRAGGYKKITLVLGASSTAIKTVLIRDIAEVVSSLVGGSQSSIYALFDIMSREGIPYGTQQQLADEVTFEQLELIVSRDKLYENHTESTESINFVEYYTAAVVVILILLWGIVCVPLIHQRDTALIRLMRLRGIGEARQIVAEYIPFAVLMSAMTLGIFAVLSALPLGEYGLLQDVAGCREYLYIGCCTLPAVWLVASMLFFLCQLSRNRISTTFLILIVTLILSFVSGFFYPLSALPDGMQSVSRTLPTTAAAEYIRAVFADAADGKALTLVLYTVMFIGLSAIVRHAKIGGARQ